MKPRLDITRRTMNKKAEWINDVYCRTSGFLPTFASWSLWQICLLVKAIKKKLGKNYVTSLLAAQATLFVECLCLKFLSNAFLLKNNIFRLTVSINFPLFFSTAGIWFIENFKHNKNQLDSFILLQSFKHHFSLKCTKKFCCTYK